MKKSEQTINREQIKTIRDLFRVRTSLTPNFSAYYYKDSNTNEWINVTWRTILQKTLRVRNALASEKLVAKDRILITLSNSIEWILIEQAAHELGLIPVSIPANSAASTIRHIALETDAKLLFLKDGNLIPTLNSYDYFSSNHIKILSLQNHNLLLDKYRFNKWLSVNQKFPAPPKNFIKPNSLATIIYTSGTTGKPKGVMLSHEALLNNAFASVEKIDLNENDRLLSVTPISHCMERIAGYYSPIITNATVCFPQSDENVKVALEEIKPTVMISTPSLLIRAYNNSTQNGTIDNFENIFGFINKNRVKKCITQSYFKSLRYIFTGGAQLPEHVTSLCEKLNLPVIEGYGLTEAGGIVTMNLPAKNTRGSIGEPITGAQLMLSDDNEILIKTNSMMLGYWKKPELTEKVLKGGLLSSNDLAEAKNRSFIIRGRKQDKIYLSTGEKLSPLPLEQRIKQDNLFKYAMVYGENRDKLAVICNIDKSALKETLQQHNLFTPSGHPQRLKTIIAKMISIRINTLIKQVPNHLPIELVIPTLDAWSTQNGLLNAKGTINRQNIEQKYMPEINKAYASNS